MKLSGYEWQVLLATLKASTQGTEYVGIKGVACTFPYKKDVRENVLNKIEQQLKDMQTEIDVTI